MAQDQRSHPPVAGALGDVTTDRLELRRFRVEDVDDLAEVFAHPEVWHFPHGRAFDRAETAAFVHRQIDEWRTCGFGCWLARERTTGRAVGYVGLSVPTFLPEILPAVEVGWRFRPDTWGRGYATEGGAAALDEAFTTLGLDEVCSVPQADNPASIRVAQRLGMRLERRVGIPGNAQRGPLTGCLFTIDRSTWSGRR